MYRLHVAGTLLGMLILSSGCATCRTPRCCDKPRCGKVCKSSCDAGACGTDKCERGPLFPFRFACQKREVSDNCLGRLFRWATYRPLCADQTDDCGNTPRCHPPLYTYFTPSQYNRCYEPVNCGGGACRPCWFGGIFRRKKCGACPDECAPERDCWTIKITLPKISFNRSCGDSEVLCRAPKCKDDLCGNNCMKLPRPISGRACENSSAGCKETAGCRVGLRGRLFGGCGACGLRGRLGTNINNKCCSSSPDVFKGDLNHLSILPPNAVTDVKPGEINKMPKANPFGTPPTTEVEAPVIKPE